MGLLQGRTNYSPFQYPQAYEFWLKQQQSHWLKTEVQMGGDEMDWRYNLTSAEKQLVGHVLKGFVTTELFIGEFWSSKVSKWFKHPEIQMMALAFAAFETIHIDAYAALNETLGLHDYEAFLHEPSAKAKIDRLMEPSGDSPEDILRSLAVFSAFNEGVSLFSAFAMLLNFKRFDKLKGVGTIIEWSVRDESLHSQAGCHFAKVLLQEEPQIWTDTLKKDIYEAARVTVQLEDDYIDQAFSFGDIEGMNAHDLKQFIRHRANTKLGDLGLKKNWKNIDMTAVSNITSWFEPLTSGTKHTDFKSLRVTDYSKGLINFGGIWE
jgi:ribonucleoside-diphosphate reductase beta chain